MNTKSIFSSKTFWFNTISILISILTIINPDFLAAYKLSPDSQKIVLTTIGFIIGVGNIILRFLTSQAVSLSGGSSTSTGTPPPSGK